MLLNPQTFAAGAAMAGLRIDWGRRAARLHCSNVSRLVPPQPKASEMAVRADLPEGLHREEITARLRAARIRVLMLRAESGFAPGHLPLFPDSILDE